MSKIIYSYIILYIICEMLKQTFKQAIPNSLLFDLLEQVCLKTDKYYFFDLNAYKKMIFLGYQYQNQKKVSEQKL